MKHRAYKPNSVFVLAVFCDILSMNIYRDFPERIGAKIYFTGQSLSVMLYILTIVLISKEVFFLNMIATAWLPFAINDFFENLLEQNNSIGMGEIVCGIAAALVIAWKMYVHYFPASSRILRMKINKVKNKILNK